MRKQVFNKARLLSWAALWGIAIAFASCSNEDVSQDKTTGTDNDNKNLTMFVTGGPEATRTTMDYATGDFYWEAGDKIYVKDDDGTWQVSSNAPTTKTAYFKFKVPGKFNNHTSYKVYYPGKGGSNNQVTIPAAQSQTEPNSTAHFGISGDCGTADANKITGKNLFEFTLDHQAAILVFLPYTSNTALKNCYLTKIEVNADNDITDTYTLDPTSGEITGTGTGKQIILTTKAPSGIYQNGFPLNTTSASVTTNGAYMLIKPGTHTLKIRYWVKDIVTNVEGTITKTLTSHGYNKNTYYNMTADLDTRVYDGDHYAYWDAQQYYWYGWEWTKNLPGGQPTVNEAHSPNYPHSNSDPRYANEYYPGTGISNPAIHTCKDLPNVNEISWYCMKGDPHWDADELWTTMGHLYKGGIWLLKKANITGFRTDKGYDNATDYRTTPPGPCENDFKPGLPSATDAHKYFYLPALGNYSGGTLYGVGDGHGIYWSSTAYPGLDDCRAYYLKFYKVSGIQGIQLNATTRYDAFRAQKFSDFGDN